MTTKFLINHVDRVLKKVGSPVSIYFGKLTGKQLEALGKWFEVKKEPMGYYKFAKKEPFKFF